MFLVAEGINALHLTVWILVFIIAIVVEISTQELVSIWFSVGAIPAIILAAFGLSFWWQLGTFAVVSAIAFVLSQIFLKKRIKINSSATNADSLVGNEILVISRVTPTSIGEGRVRDVVWTIASDETIEKDEFAIVKEIKGNKLIVMSKEKK
ncbi:MAG: NfeD family protein [Erysipelotrichaceae bacterium]|nr:NfeD family protein [Erysipelotrichaceae bacterium]